MKDADVYEAVEHLGAQIERIAHALTPQDSMPYKGPIDGAVVNSVTEALIGVGKGLQACSSSLSDIAEAILVVGGEK